ncbi:transposase [Niveispirillum sp. BGYR6]|uniref:transposase n=1 Tax=Niveispirillum sp. BGYR6 TaxID=2971249 RepID=UPI0022B97544|nr:transposase [Niveispirillum sp. BGYR6]MDG5496274.1 transposase [Niveispirillum sp. BGYR6]
MVRVKQGKVTAELKRDALRILSTSGRTVAEVAADLGIGKSTLQRWKTEATETDFCLAPIRTLKRNWHGFGTRTRFYVKSGIC